MDNILSQRCLLTERTEKTRAMKEREAWEKDLPACRRLLFPLLHACNKGNRRRLHAGKRKTRMVLRSVTGHQIANHGIATLGVNRENRRTIRGLEVS